MQTEIEELPVNVEGTEVRTVSTIDKLCKVRNIRNTTWNAYKWYTSTFFFTKLQFIILAVDYHKPNKYWNSVMQEQVRLKGIKDVPTTDY